jgi:hypothetical protein
MSKSLVGSHFDVFHLPGATVYWQDSKSGEWGKYRVLSIDTVAANPIGPKDSVVLIGVEGVDVRPRVVVTADSVFLTPPFLSSLKPGDSILFKEGNPDDMYALYRVSKIYTSTGEIFDARTQIDITREDGHKFPIAAGELSVEHNQPGPEAVPSFNS